MADGVAGSGGGSGGAGYSYGSVSQAVAIAAPMTPPGLVENTTAATFSKMYVSPQYLQFRLGPGKSDSLSFSVTNRGKEQVSVRPHMADLPYAGVNSMDTSWVSVSPEEIKVAPGEKGKFTVTVTVPSDVTKGYYSGQLALTDEQYPGLYQSPYNGYIYSVSLSTEVYTPAVLSVTPYVLSDSLETGKGYDYSVVLKNNGDHAIAINPRLENQMYSAPVTYYGQGGTSLMSEESIRISAPAEIPVRDEANMNVHVEVPADAGGYYYGAINLGTDDPAVQTGEGNIQLTFVVWKQPAIPFTKSFSMKDDCLVTIELVASRDIISVTGPAAENERSGTEPSFDLSIDGPSGKVTPNLTKRMIKGSVSFSGEGSAVPLSKDVPYQEVGVQYVSTYSLPGKAGLWSLAIMPHNMGRFDYTIIMGPSGELSFTPPQSQGTTTTREKVANLTLTSTAPGSGDSVAMNNSSNQSG